MQKTFQLSFQKKSKFYLSKVDFVKFILCENQRITVSLENLFCCEKREVGEFFSLQRFITSDFQRVDLDSVIPNYVQFVHAEWLVRH